MISDFMIIDRNVMLDNDCVYKISYSITLDDKTIYYLINTNDFSDMKFCYLIGEDELEEILDKEKLVPIIEKFNRDINTFIRD